MAGAIIGGAIGGIGSMFGGKAQADAASRAAEAQTKAATYAANVQAQSAAKALEFQKQQAAQDLMRADATQRGNYDQWAARQGRLSTLGQMVGMQPFQIPGYVPLTGANQVTPSGTPANSPNPNVRPMSDLLRAPAQ